MRFEKDQSYFWLFVSFLITFVVCGLLWAFVTKGPRWPVLLLPGMLAFLIVSELRSKVVLDRWWWGKYVPGDLRYTAVLTWHAFVLVVFFALSVYVLRSVV